MNYIQKGNLEICNLAISLLRDRAISEEELEQVNSSATADTVRKLFNKAMYDVLSAYEWNFVKEIQRIEAELAPPVPPAPPAPPAVDPAPIYAQSTHPKFQYMFNGEELPQVIRLFRIQDYDGNDINDYCLAREKLYANVPILYITGLFKNNWENDNRKLPHDIYTLIELRLALLGCGEIVGSERLQSSLVSEYYNALNKAINDNSLLEPYGVLFPLPGINCSRTAGGLRFDNKPVMIFDDLIPWP